MNLSYYILISISGNISQQISSFVGISANSIVQAFTISLFQVIKLSYDCKMDVVLIMHTYMNVYNNQMQRHKGSRVQQWCITLRNSLFLDFIHCLIF
jgi:hypothetical protein